MSTPSRSKNTAGLISPALVMFQIDCFQQFRKACDQLQCASLECAEYVLMEHKLQYLQDYLASLVFCPVSAMLLTIHSLAILMASITLALLPLVEIPTSTSPVWPNPAIVWRRSRCNRSHWQSP